MQLHTLKDEQRAMSIPAEKKNIQLSIIKHLVKKWKCQFSEQRVMKMKEVFSYSLTCSEAVSEKAI